jgi:hypothetical protein
MLHYKLLCNLKEAYVKFKETQPYIAIRFSKCSGLPEDQTGVFCFVLMVHMFTIHENMKLTMQVIDWCP